MKFENTQVFNFEGALRGMRNPKESWVKSDSHWSDGLFIIGQNDLKLAQTLIRAGSEHRKFMRQIIVSVDITAPIYWWKQMDTYKVGTTTNSTSTMHKLSTTPISMERFELGDYNGDLNVFNYPLMDRMNVDDFITKHFIPFLEQLRLKYLETKNVLYWKELIRWLPESWMQTRTQTMTYENLLAMCSVGQRRFHKLNEWKNDFITWARSLPYAQQLIFIDELEQKSGDTA